MGTYLTRFIEIKNKETGKWELIKRFRKHFKIDWEFKDYWKDNHPNFTVEGQEMAIKPYYACDNACNLRQYFSDSWANEFTDKDYGLRDRGMPEDISDELKEYLEKEYETSKYWGLTWCTHHELVEMCFSEQKAFFETLVKLIKKEGENKVADQLDHIVANMNLPIDQRTKFVPKEVDEEEEEGVQYHIDEMIWGFRSIDDELTRIDYILDDLNNHWNRDDVRIILYFE